MVGSGSTYPYVVIIPLIGHETTRLGESAPKLGEYGSIVNAVTILYCDEQKEQIRRISKAPNI